MAGVTAGTLRTRLSLVKSSHQGHAFKPLLTSRSRTKNETKEVVHWMGAARVSEGSRWVEEEAPPDRHRAVHSGVGRIIVLHESQMRGLKTIPASRRDGQGPESSLKRLWNMDVHLDATVLVQPYGHSPNSSIFHRSILQINNSGAKTSEYRNNC